MRRNRIRLSEGQLRRVIKESVRRILREEEDGKIFDSIPLRDTRDTSKSVTIQCKATFLNKFGRPSGNYNSGVQIKAEDGDSLDSIKHEALKKFYNSLFAGPLSGERMQPLHKKTPDVFEAKFENGKGVIIIIGNPK